MDALRSNVRPPPAWGGLVKNLRTALIIVDGKIGVRLKKSDLPFALYRNSAGGYISDTPVRECYSGIRYIGLVRQHRHPHGLYPIHGRAHQAGDDVDIVNHEIQHHIDIGSTLDKRR